MIRTISKNTIIFLCGLHECCTFGYRFEATEKSLHKRPLGVGNTVSRKKCTYL